MKDQTWERAGFGLIAAILLAVFYVVGVAVRADGAIDYCWIESNSSYGVPKVYYSLVGHRPWRSDARIGIFDTFEEAAKAAERATCPLHR